MGMLDELLGIYSSYQGLEDADRLENYGQQIGYDMGALGRDMVRDTAFQGYGVTSALGNTNIGANGSVNMGVGPNMGMQDQANAYMNSSQQLMNQSMMNPAARQQQIYGQMMAAQQPALDRAQAAQQAREYAMGRGGVRGSQFGGTAEDAAMARARVEGSNQAQLAAMQQAMAEQAQMGTLASNYGQLGQSQYDASFLPMRQQLALMQLAGQDADRAQTGQLTGQGYLGQTVLGGLQTAVNAKKAATELRGNIYDSIFDNAAGLFEGILGAVTKTE